MALSQLLELAPQLLAELEELIQQLPDVADLIGPVELLVQVLPELLAELAELIRWRAEILRLTSLAELVPDLLTTLNELAEVGDPGEPTKQLVKIAKSVDLTTSTIILAGLAHVDGLTG